MYEQIVIPFVNINIESKFLASFDSVVFVLINPKGLENVIKIIKLLFATSKRILLKRLRDLLN